MIWQKSQAFFYKKPTKKQPFLHVRTRGAYHFAKKEQTRSAPYGK